MTYEVALKSVEDSDEYNQWRLKDPDSYLSYLFTVIEENQKPIWDVGYYNPNSKSVIVFSVRTEGVFLHDEAKAMNTKEAYKLESDKVKIDDQEAYEILSKLKEKKMPKSQIIKTVCILQQNNTTPIWNMTSITNDFKTWNVKIDASNGKVLDEKPIKLFDFDKKE